MGELMFLVRQQISYPGEVNVRNQKNSFADIARLSDGELLSHSIYFSIINP